MPGICSVRPYDSAFESAQIALANGRQLHVKANNPARNQYIKEVRLNGKNVDTVYLTYDQILEGGELEFVLSSKPSSDWGVSQETRPYSMTVRPVAAAPYTSAATMLFEDNVSVDLNTNTPDAHIRYTLDGTDPTEASMTYTGPFTLTESCLIKAVALSEGYAPSGVAVINVVKACHHPALNREFSENGVNYRYYEGGFTRTAMIGNSPVVSKGVLPEPSLDFVKAEDHYGIIFDGYIQVPEKGIWEFATCTDDGSVLLIDGEKVVDNDGGTCCDYCHRKSCSRSRLPFIQTSLF